MENLVQINEKNQPITTSLLVAEKFGKEHSSVMRSIKNLINSEQNCSQFYVSASYIDNSGKSNQMYLMNRDGFTLLAMGFTGKKAMAFKLEYIEAFNKMENQLKAEQKPLSTIDILELTIKGLRENQQEITEIKQKVKEIEAKNITRPDCFSIAGYASLYGMPVNIDQAKVLGVKARKLCKDQNILVASIPDPRFGKVNVYPTNILNEVFKKFYN